MISSADSVRWSFSSYSFRRIFEREREREREGESSRSAYLETRLFLYFWGATSYYREQHGQIFFRMTRVCDNAGQLVQHCTDHCRQGLVETSC